MKNLFLSVLLALSIFSLRAQSITNYLLDSTRVDIDVVVGAGQCKAPWDIAWSGDNRLWFTDNREIRAYNPAANGTKTIYKKNSGNFMGLVLHPDFPVTPEVFATWDISNYYAFGQDIRVLKYLYDSVGDSLYNETELVKWDHPGEHSGGRIMISFYNKLLVTTAEYYCAVDASSNPGIYNKGRVLRMNLDGTVPSDNPISGSFVYTSGHRNPQGIVQAPDSNIYISEFGDSQDELNRLIPGRYYGWPAYDGFVNMGGTPCDSITFPIDAGIHPPSGIDYYTHSQIPEFKNCILESVLSFGGTIGGIIAFQLNATGDTVKNKKHYFIGSGMERIRDVAVAPNGDVYVISNDRKNIIYSPNVDSDARIRVIRKASPVNINATMIQSNLFIFPNPSNGLFQISNPRLQIQRLEVYNVMGEEVYQSSILNPVGNIFNGINPQLLIDLRSQPGGVYVLKVKATNGVSVQKIIKE